VSGQRHAPAGIYPGKDPVPIVQEAVWGPGPVWIGAENLAPPPGFDPRTIQPVALAIPTELPGLQVAFTYIYTGYPRRNVPDFGRVFLMLKYTDITQNTYVQS